MNTEFSILNTGAHIREIDEHWTLAKHCSALLWVQWMKIVKEKRRKEKRNEFHLKCAKIINASINRIVNDMPIDKKVFVQWFYHPFYHICVTNQQPAHCVIRSLNQQIQKLNVHLISDIVTINFVVNISKNELVSWRSFYRFLGFQLYSYV